MLDFSFWNEPEVVSARAEIIASAEAFEAGSGGETALERAVIVFNAVVEQVRTRLGHYENDETDDGLSDEEHRMVLGRRLEDAKVPPPQIANLVRARACLLAAVRDLDKPLGKWEREFIFNCSCGVYETAGIAARREQKERERAWRGTKSGRPRRAFRRRPAPSRRGPSRLNRASGKWLRRG
ncbi:hypothetical protein [Filomicrobium sp.]|uniref:hypothetical protein n=1 Tax=Filomicrobium sp. TaxID=2024831 RepID=UPI00258E4843|nr:hypothetical protein [Filomicrobium sp.]MCV0371752.1 hypothetical protein [Filomicrobium sp.]